MITVITSSSALGIVPVGERSVDIIHEITAEVFHYEDEEEHIVMKERRLGP